MVKISIDAGADYTGELRERLKKYKITNAELAREMGIDPSMISRWLRKGSAQPQYGNIVKIENAILAIRTRRTEERKQSKADSK